MKNKNKTYPPIFISGPHGGGKSTLLEKLKASSNLFIENDFDIDFTIDFSSLSSLSHFERSLIRLYHRFFIASYANLLARKNPGKFILTNRAVYDSEAYINAYRKLKWISEAEFKTLNFIMKNFPKPRAIILNPPLGVIKKRLALRRGAATRINRDKIFKSEDSDIFLKNLRRYFEKFGRDKRVLYVEDNVEAEVKKIIKILSAYSPRRGAF